MVVSFLVSHSEKSPSNTWAPSPWRRGPAWRSPTPPSPSRRPLPSRTRWGVEGVRPGCPQARLQVERLLITREVRSIPGLCHSRAQVPPGGAPPHLPLHDGLRPLVLAGEYGGKVWLPRSRATSRAVSHSEKIHLIPGLRHPCARVRPGGAGHRPLLHAGEEGSKALLLTSRATQDQVLIPSKRDFLTPLLRKVLVGVVGGSGGVTHLLSAHAGEGIDQVTQGQR